MIWVIKVISCITLLFIAYQDFKERRVYWFLFPLLGASLLYLHFLHTGIFKILTYYILLNIILISLILLILFLFTNLVLKKQFLNHSFGLGDILFFYAFALGFPTITFTILFANALIFSFLFFFILKKTQNFKTAPLAGLMSLFLFFILGISIFTDTTLLYNL